MLRKDRLDVASEFHLSIYGCWQIVREKAYGVCQRKRNNKEMGSHDFLSDKGRRRNELTSSNKVGEIWRGIQRSADSHCTPPNAALIQQNLIYLYRSRPSSDYRLRQGKGYRSPECGPENCRDPLRSRRAGG